MTLEEKTNKKIMRNYILDVQGSMNDTFNPKKYENKVNINYNIMSSSKKGIFKETLENVIKKIKQIARTPVKAKDITLFGAISLASLVGCENKPMISPLGPRIENTAYLPTETKFSGDSFQVEFRPLEKPYQKVEGRGDKPTQPMSDWIELSDTNQDGLYTIALSSNATPLFGPYHVQPGYTSGGRRTEGQIYTVILNMNETQSDTILPTIINPLVKAGSTTDGDIIAASYNQGVVLGASPYNVDAFLMIYDSTMPAKQRRYALDVQGSINDTFNQQKYDDAKAVNVSYSNIGPYSESNSTAGLESVVNGLQSAGWQRTDQ